MRKVECSIPGRERSKSLKQVVTAPLLNGLLKVRVSLVIGDDKYIRLAHVTIGGARQRTVTAQWP